MAVTPPAKQRTIFNASIITGDSGNPQRAGLDVSYTEAATSNVLFSREIALAPNTTDTAINLANEMAACKSWGLVDETVGSTANVAYASTAGAATKFQLDVGGACAHKQLTGAPPTLYLTNASPTDTLYVRVSAIGSR